MKKVRFSPFSVILVMVALSVIGIASFGMLRIQYKPASGGHSISVSYTMAGASSEVIEAEVTSKIEGVLSGLKGCSGISSVSRMESGTVNVSFDKNTDMAAARFDVASAVRNVYPSLPKSVSYPSISLDVSGNKNSTAITYLIKGSLPSLELRRFAETVIQPQLSALKGVDKVSISGSTPFQWVITFDADRVASLGITARDIADAFNSRYGDSVLGVTEITAASSDKDASEEALSALSADSRLMAVRLKMAGDTDFGSILVKRCGDRIIYLRDIATWKYEESLPRYYYRINGLNTITLSVSVAGDANLISAASAIKSKMADMQDGFPEGITVSIGYDASEFVAEELDKIYIRTGLCLLILLLFVFLVNRSWRSTLIVTAALTVNILIAVAAYAFLQIPVHIYTMAGITVSLGIVIDTTIVMADHYGYYRNRGAFPDLVAAILTTVAALLLILLLPESERGNLTDFIWVISINLCISLAVAFFFIPALMEYFPVHGTDCSASFKRRRRVVRFNHLYSGYISWGIKYRWVYVVVFIIAFGIPLFLLPKPGDKKQGTFYEKVVRPVLSWRPYAANRQVIDKWAGSTFGLFYKSLDRANFYREPEKKTLYIRAGMPEGCSVQQLNDVVRSMENYLASFSEISVFTTRINSYDDATIAVEFRPEFENTSFPSMLKSKVTSMAINFGGADWSVSGVDQNYFNNSVGSEFKSCHITLYGYNYKELYRYAEKLTEHLSLHRRVSGIEIWSTGWNGSPSTEFVLDYDFGRLASVGADPYAYYGTLSSLLYDETIASMPMGGEMTDIVLRSSGTDTYDLWHVLNEPVETDSVKMTLTDIGSITKKRTGIDIRKRNQSYELNVCFDYIGSYELAKKVTAAEVAYMNEEVLPVGFRAEDSHGGWFDEHKDRYVWLIFLIVAVIYVMLAMTFESLRYPLAVIFMIPISFIGLFLVFGLSDYAFDQGGFAAFVMLCGVVVNAGIYLVNTWQRQGRRHGYIRAFNHKINPIMLTILSTVLGLIPFLTDGPEEVFWFDFAVGTIGGMLFSVIALVFVLPVFLLDKSCSDRCSGMDCAGKRRC